MLVGAVHSISEILKHKFKYLVWLNTLLRQFSVSERVSKSGLNWRAVTGTAGRRDHNGKYQFSRTINSVTYVDYIMTARQYPHLSYRLPTKVLVYIGLTLKDGRTKRPCVRQIHTIHSQLFKNAGQTPNGHGLLFKPFEAWYVFFQILYITR